MVCSTFIVPWWRRPSEEASSFDITNMAPGQNLPDELRKPITDVSDVAGALIKKMCDGCKIDQLTVTKKNLTDHLYI